MSILRRLPGVSLSLLLLTYTTYGWLISKAKFPPVIWLLVIAAIFSLVGGLTTPWRKMTNYSFALFKSNLRSFSVTLLAAFLFFLMIAWFRLFLNALVIISATILARIDFQTAGFNERQAFWVLSVASLTSLLFGVLIYKFTEQMGVGGTAPTL